VHCLISKEKINPFHSFEKRTIFNKPVRELPQVSTTRMDIAYNPQTSHISSKLAMSDHEIHDLHTKIYTELYETYAQVGLSPLQKSYTDFIAKWLISLVPNQGSVLEVGCHDGYLLNLLDKEGFKTFGVEPSPMADFAKNQFGLNVKNEFFSEDSFDGKKFDFIIMRHVIEHVSDPVEFLNIAYSKLNDGGRIYIEVPNSLWSLSNSFFPEFHIDHISYFTQSSLRNLIDTLKGVKILHLEQFSGYIKFPFLGALIEKTSNGKNDSLHTESLQEFIVPNSIENFQKNYRNYMTNLNNIDSSEKIIVWGTGSIGTQFSVDAEWTNHDEIFYVDINSNNIGLKLSTTGQEIFSPELIKELKPKIIVIASAWENDVLNQMQNFISGNEEIITYSELLKEK
jgi:2-polyprenyl-3-methyl-5-hydroxy-6-metoxy-1,4-benzoquinol methylase